MSTWRLSHEAALSVAKLVVVSICLLHGRRVSSRVRGVARNRLTDPGLVRVPSTRTSSHTPQPGPRAGTRPAQSRTNSRTPPLTGNGEPNSSINTSPTTAGRQSGWASAGDCVVRLSGAKASWRRPGLGPGTPRVRSVGRSGTLLSNPIDGWRSQWSARCSTMTRRRTRRFRVRTRNVAHTKRMPRSAIQMETGGCCRRSRRGFRDESGTGIENPTSPAQPSTYGFLSTFPPTRETETAK